MRWSVLVVGLCGCGVAELSAGAGDALDDAEQAERWAAEDSPFLFSTDLETRLDALPSAGEVARVPWAGSYWPVSADTINFRWAGAASESPAKKYERAFGGSGVEDAVSRVHGIEGASGQRACARDFECEASRGEVCGKRPGRASGRCIPTWWGICHAWAPAAILWPEPRGAVVRNGVRFEVQDLKALASLVHDRTRTRFVSLRCNTASSAFAFDHYGRPAAGACRDTNAGTYHVLLANQLGRLRQSFVVDRTVDDEVWNQPLRSFRVLSGREVGAAEANRLLGTSGTAYRFNADARRLVYVVTEVRWIAESEPGDGFTGARIDAYTRADRYEYVLELDGAGKIIGGEWVGASKASHPDFAWLPLGAATTTVAGGAIAYEKVKGMVLESAAAAAPAWLSTSGTVKAGELKVYAMRVSGGRAVVVRTASAADVDLYVRQGAAPTLAAYDARGYTTSGHELVRFVPPAAGTLMMAVRGFAAGAFTLTATEEP